jgi:sec-independent protein translocase protein TatA
MNAHPLFISMPGPSEWLLILLVILILFGGKKIPQFARDFGTGIREFRKSLSSAAQSEEEAHPSEEQSRLTQHKKRATPTASAKKSRKA